MLDVCGFLPAFCFYDFAVYPVLVGCKNGLEVSHSVMMTGASSGKDRVSVQDSAKFVHHWLLNPSALRDFCSACSDGGVFFVSSCHIKTGAAAVRFRKEHDCAPPGIMENDFIGLAVARLCD